jgi:ubiquinone/menaquinone biosynthesis C-methylase UbiE
MKDLMRFENSSRLAELDILASLEKAGFKADFDVCDYGAGTGIVAATIAKETSGKVYALDKSEEMLAIIKDKKKQEGLKNLEIIQVEEDVIDLADDCVDLFVMVTVFHHIEVIPSFMDEMKRVLREKGKAMIIDFHKKDSPMGPPSGHRISDEDVIAYFKAKDMSCSVNHYLGENFYLLVFEK